MKTEKTIRGFEIIRFNDHNEVPCSLQQSSLMLYGQPGSGAIWLGCQNANPRALIPGKGWMPIPMPAEYLADTRMHLDRKQVRALIKHLQAWVDTGTFRFRKTTDRQQNQNR